MVSIVIVSHSSKAAEGIKEIALQMAEDPELKIFSCGGSKGGGIGTDPDEISKALENAYSKDGTVVMADLGSAVMSVEMIIENMPGGKGHRIRIADAPIVEGAVLAAVEASGGGDLKKVLASAEAARDMRKIEGG